MQCTNHEVQDHLLLQYFYMSLDVVNKTIADNLVQGGHMKQTFARDLEFLDEMTKIHRAWYTRDDMVTPHTFVLTNEQIQKNQERDENMAKMLTQLDLLTKHVMESQKSMNAIGANGNLTWDDAPFDAAYNEEVQFLKNQVGGFCLEYQRPGENQGWNQDWDRDWRDRGSNSRERDFDRDHLPPPQGYYYVPPHDHQKTMEQKGGP